MNEKSVFSRYAKRTIAIWISLLFLVVLTHVGLLALLAVSLTGAMPFILLILWLGLTEQGEKLRGWFDVWQVRAFFGAFLFCYVTYGHKWAGDVINELFHVDAKFFGITSAVLTVLFTPFGIFYRPDVAGSALDIFNLIVAVVAPLCFIYLFVLNGIENRGRKILSLLVGIFCTTFVLAFVFDISKDFKPAVKAFALWADFNESNLCTDAWAQTAKSVVFLDDGKVLAYFPGESDYKFQVVSCNYAKKF